MHEQIETDIEKLNPFPVMGKYLNESNSQLLDFTAKNKELLAIDLKDTETFNSYVFGLLAESHKEFGWGGYLEDREIYKRSTHFQQGEPRNFHLGIDIWAKAGSAVYCPLAAKVHSSADNNNFGDYGPTIILEHQIENDTIYTLYGHLSRESLNNLQEGQVIEKGNKFCEIGPYPENGDWPPHLHFQVMKDMLGNKGDFPGVCSASQLANFKAICINPEIFIR